MLKFTFLLEADLDGDKVLEEDIVYVGVVEVKELFQLCRLGIFWKTRRDIKLTINKDTHTHTHTKVNSKLSLRVLDSSACFNFVCANTGSSLCSIPPKKAVLREEE